MDPTYHAPVLCNEAVGYLMTDRTGTYVDGTVGGGGHAEEICRRLTGEGRLVCFDADDDAIRHARERLAPFEKRISFVHANVDTLRDELRRLRIDAIAGLLLDLGVSSFQLDEGSRGFSFRSDGRLDMRMDRRQPFSALEVVNTYEEKRLAEVLWKFGEERNSRRVARKIAAARPVETTGNLRSAVEAAVGQRMLVKTLARVFQALRIEVNRELESLKRALADAMDLIVPGGRIVAISYHSLEDRIVKDFFRREALRSISSGFAYVADTPRSPRLRVLTRHPLGAAPEEVRRNPRARSAKMRVAERLAG